MTAIIEGDAEDVTEETGGGTPPPEPPEGEAPAPEEPQGDPTPEPAPPAPMYPPEVQAGISRAMEEAQAHGGAIRQTRRVPETDEWFVVIERSSGGFVVMGWTGEGQSTQRGALMETMRESAILVETLATGAPPPGADEPQPPPKTLFSDDPVARLAWAKEQAKIKIDTDAETARLKYITGGAGQAMEYLASEAEADQVLVAGPGFQIPDNPLLFPFLRAEAAVAGTTLYEAAQVTSQAAALWRQVGAAIKGLRLGGKAAVNAAETEEAVWSATLIEWAKPPTD